MQLPWSFVTSLRIMQRGTIPSHFRTGKNSVPQSYRRSARKPVCGLKISKAADYSFGA